MLGAFSFKLENVGDIYNFLQYTQEGGGGIGRLIY